MLAEKKWHLLLKINKKAFDNNKKIYNKGTVYQGIGRVKGNQQGTVSWGNKYSDHIPLLPGHWQTSTRQCGTAEAVHSSWGSELGGKGVELEGHVNNTQHDMMIFPAKQVLFQHLLPEDHSTETKNFLNPHSPLPFISKALYILVGLLRTIWPQLFSSTLLQFTHTAPS